MEISHVIRGEDHIPNTPKHILLFKALEFKTPYFAHLSMIMGADNTPLSKRHGVTSVQEYRKKGYLPESLVNYLTLLGWSAENEEEIFDQDKAKGMFSLERINKSSAIFDINKLNWVNSNYLRKTSISRITDLAIPYLQEENLLTGNISESMNNWLLKIMHIIVRYLNCISEVPRYAKIFFDKDLEYTEEAKKILKEEQIPMLLQNLKEEISKIEKEELSVDDFKIILQKVQEISQIKGKALYQPIRAALTGSISGPELIEIIPLINTQTLSKRIEQAVKI